MEPTPPINPQSSSPAIPAISSTRSPTEILARAQSVRRMIQDFRPISESIEVELSRLYFQERGTRAFVRNHVPFEINNDGNFSTRAATVLFESLKVSEEAGTLEPTVCVLELGVGSGLFARFLLDHFRELCTQHSKDYYDRLIYVLTDKTAKMLDDLDQQGLFAAHGGHYRFVCADAMQPDIDLRGMDNFGPEETPRFRAVFLNYILDMLPNTALRFDDDGVRQLFVRTCLARDIDFAEYRLTPEQIAKRVESDDPSVRRALVDLYPLFALEYSYRPIALDSLPYGDFAREYDRGKSPYLLHSHGALHCLDRLRGMLDNEGFIIVNDYGQINPDQSREEIVHQHYGGSIACEINFLLMRDFCRRKCELTWAEPEGEIDLIHSRLIGRAVDAKVQKCFATVYGRAGYDEAQRPVQQARQLQQNGRIEQALVAYEKALKKQPYNWVLADEVARFLMTRLDDYEAAMQMSQHGLTLNPTCSASLWNNLGDCRKALKLPNARECFEQALKIDPDDPRGHFGLGLVLASANEYGAALRKYADALVRDKTGEYRERIQNKQNELLTRLRNRWEHESRNLTNRVNQMIDADDGTG